MGGDRIGGGRTIAALALGAALGLAGCGSGDRSGTVLTISGSAVGDEATVLRTLLARFEREHPGLRVELRETPDAADLRHQLYVQWLNARVPRPDVLQIDVVWTAELAAAGWLRPLDGPGADLDGFVAGAAAAARWRGRTWAIPWFVDVGVLYRRTDLAPDPPESLAALAGTAARLARSGRVADGFVWQGARYEGLVCVFLEVLGGFGGRILDDRGRVVVDSDAGVRALTWMRDLLRGASPEAVLTWKEEQTRFAFQNGRAAFMRNWPYAWRAMDAPDRSTVAGRYAVSLLPAGSGGEPTAALGGALLAINARSRHPREAFALVRFLTSRDAMVERLRAVGQLPARVDAYDDPAVARTLGATPAAARTIVAAATPRPVTPVWTDLSRVLQIGLHRALSGQAEPAAALREAAGTMRSVLRRAGLEATGDDGADRP